MKTVKKVFSLLAIGLFGASQLPAVTNDNAQAEGIDSQESILAANDPSLKTVANSDFFHAC